MHRCRGGYPRERNTSISHINIELIAWPTHLMALGVLLRAHITDPGQIGKTLLQAPFTLLFKALLLGNRSQFVFLGTAPLALHLWRGSLDFLRGLLPGLYRGRITRYMPDHIIAHILFDKRLVNLVGQIALSKLVECSTESRFARYLIPILPSAQLPKSLVPSQTRQQCPGGRNVVESLSHERAGKRLTVLGLATKP